MRAIAPDGVNTIVEVSPAVNAALDAEVLARHGSVAVYANNGGSTMELPVRPSMVPNARWQFVLVYNAPDTVAGARAGRRRRGRAATEPSGSGPRPGLPLHHYPLEQAAEAHAAVENGAVGKVLIDVRALIASAVRAFCSSWVVPPTGFEPAL